MKKIIALQGAGSTGKTETILNVFDELKLKYPQAQFEKFSKGRDIKIIMDIHGKKIGIESQGDPNSRLKKSLEDFANNNCEIIICACRTTGMTVNWVNTYKSLYQISFFRQILVTTNQRTTNKKTAKKIVTLAGL